MAGVMSIPIARPVGPTIISDRNLQTFQYNVVAFGKQGHFAKRLQACTPINLDLQA